MGHCVLASAFRHFGELAQYSDDRANDGREEALLVGRNERYDVGLLKSAEDYKERREDSGSKTVHMTSFH